MIKIQVSDLTIPRIPSTGIIRLVLTNFRTYQKLSLSCDTRPVVLTGPNGIGKTNILEAISFLSPGRGLRNAKLAQVTHRTAAINNVGNNDHDHDTADDIDDRHNSDDHDNSREDSNNFNHKDPAWAVAVTYSTPDQGFYLGTGLQFHDGKEKRIVQIDGEILKTQTKLTDYINILWLTPQMDRLFAEGSSLKRQFFDRLIYGFDPTHATRLHRYEHCMRERNDLLYKNYCDSSWLTVLEQKMAAEAVAIAAARKWLCTQLQQAESWTLGLMALPRLELDGIVEKSLDDHKALAAEELFADHLKVNRSQDQQAGRALLGVHRTDLRVTHATKAIDADHCSTGEQKAMMMTIIMATARLQAHIKKTVPLLLLDEIAAHFDKQKREMLFAEMLDLGMQVWMTGADAEIFRPLGDNAQHYAVENGSIRTF